MAFTPEEIDSAVRFYTDATRQQQRIINNPSGSLSRSGVVTPGGGAPAPSGGSRQGKSPSDIIREQFWWMNIMPGGIGSAELIAQAVEPMEEDETPNNAVQWLLNFLGIGLYSAANVGNELGKALPSLRKKTEEGGLLGAIDANMEAGGAVLRGLGYGISEGFGARHDRDGDGKTERPRTWGQNFEDIGINDWVRDTARSMGATDDGAGFWDNTGTWVGLTGLAGDIIGDPLTYVAGTGLLKGLSGAAKGARSALEAGQGVRGVISGAAREGSAARREALDALKEARAEKKAGNQLRRTGGGYEEELLTQAGRQADDVARAADDVAIDDVVRAADDAVVNDAATPRSPGLDAKRADAAASSISILDDLARSPDVSGSAGRAVDVDRILSDARVPLGGGGDLPAEAAANLSQAVRTASTLPEVNAAVKALANSSPAAKKFLNETKVTVGGKSVTLAKAAEVAFTRRVSNAPSARADINAVEEALRAGVGRMGITPQSMAAAIARNVDDAPAQGSPEMRDLLQRLGGAKGTEARKKVILDQFGLKTTRFENFDDLMTKLANGTSLQAPPEVMREMLKALGVKTKLTDPNLLAKTLNGQGRHKWETLQASLRTPREVVTDHGITPEAAAAASVLDDIAVARVGLRDYEAYVQKLGYDPAKITMPRYNKDGTPRAGAGTGNAIAHGIATMGKLLRGKQSSEAFGGKMAVEMHKAVLASLKLSRGKLEGTVRGESLYPSYIPAIRAIEEYARSLGQIPYLKGRAGQPNLYVSLGQVVEALPRTIAVRWLSSSMAYRLGREVGDPIYKQGLSVYPSTLHEGAAAAVRGAAAGRSGNELALYIREAMEAENRGRNLFQRTEMGQRQLDELAATLADDGFLNRIRPLNIAQEAQWIRMAQSTASDLLLPITTRISGILARNGDRGELVTELRRAYAEVAKHTEIDEGQSFARDLATTRMDNALVNGLLDEFDTALARFDARAAATTPKVGRPQTGKAAAETAAATRKAASQNKEKLLDEIDDQIDENLSELVATGQLENTTSAVLATKAELQADALMNGLWGKVAGGIQKLGVATKGSYGQGELNATRQIAERGSKTLDTMFRASIYRQWLPGRNGALQRLGDDLGLGRPATIAEFDEASRGWWHALAAHVRVDLGVVPARGALRTALLRGLPANPDKGVRDAVQPLTPAQADLAMELYDKILRVFNPHGGPLERSGLLPEDVNFYLKRGGMEDFAFREGLPLREQVNLWAMFDDVKHPLNVILGFHRAMTLAYQRPMLAAMVTKQVGVRRGTEGADELAKAGWRGIDPSSGTLGKHFDPDVLFPPDVHQQLAWVQRYLDELDVDPQARVVRGAYRFFDRVASILKPSMTTWRPGHHGTIILGNNLLMLGHGFNPLQNGRVLSAMRHLSGQGAHGPKAARMSDDEFGAALSQLERDWDVDLKEAIAPGVRGSMKPKMLDQGVNMRFKDGTALRLEPENLAFLSRRYGVNQDPHQAVDMIPERESINFASIGSRISQSRINLIAKTNRAIGRYTSWEENVTRLSVMYQVLESRAWNSMDEAMQEVMRAIMRTHPTREALSAAERRHATHVVLFYTWVKGALGSITEMMLERPGAVTVPSKFQYNMAEGHGLEPESIGKPIPSDPRIASYYKDGVVGPSWAGGLSPFGGTDDLPEGEAPHLWGANLNAPQIDALSAFFGGLNFGEDPSKNVREFASGVNPVLGASAEWFFDKQLGFESSKPISDNYADWIWQQTGFPAAVTNVVGLTGVKSSYTEAEQQGEQARKVVNFLTGLKITDYTNPTSARIARSEQGKSDLEYLRSQGFTEEEIRWIRSWWKELRSSEK